MPPDRLTWSPPARDRPSKRAAERWLSQSARSSGCAQQSRLNPVLNREAAAAMADVVEAHCPLCHVRLVVHDDRACRLCGGLLLPPEERTSPIGDVGSMSAASGPGVRALAAVRESRRLPANDGP